MQWKHLKGGEKVNVIGSGVNNASVASAKMPKESMIMNQSGFKQMLRSIRMHHGATGALRSANQSGVKADQAGIKPIADLLSFLKTTDLLQLDGGKELLSQLTANPQSDILSLVKDYFGISEQKWSEMMNQLGQDPTQMSGDGNKASEAMMSILSGLSQGVLPANLNGNISLFLKSAKLFDLLSAYQNPEGKNQNLSFLLSTAASKLQEGIQSNQHLTKQKMSSQQPVGFLDKYGGSREIDSSQQNLPLGINSIQELLTLLAATNLQQLNGGQELLSQIQANPNLDVFQAIQNGLGISAQKLSEILNDLTTVASQVNLNQNGQPVDIFQANKNDLGISKEKWSAILNDLTKQLQQTQQNGTQVASQVNLSQNSQLTDIFQANKNDLGISSQKWAEIIDQLNSRLKNGNQDLSAQIISERSKVNSDPLQSNQILTAKLYELLSTVNGKAAEQPSSTPFLELINGKIQEMTLGNQNNWKQSNFQSAFLKEENQTSGAASKEQLAKVDVPVWGSNPLSFHSMSKPEQLSIMLNGSQNNSSTSDIMKQFESILAKSQFSKMNGVQRLLIKLSPENLGTMSIEVVQKDHTIVAKILASTEAAKDILKSQLNGLKSSFAAQNIQVDKVEISMQSTQSPQEQFSNRNQQNHQEQNNEQQDQKTKQNNENAGNDFTFSLEEALFNMEA